jgi:hypothetical protein
MSDHTILSIDTQAVGSYPCSLCTHVSYSHDEAEDHLRIHFPDSRDVNWNSRIVYALFAALIALALLLPAPVSAADLAPAIMAQTSNVCTIYVYDGWVVLHLLSVPVGGQALVYEGTPGHYAYKGRAMSAGYFNIASATAEGARYYVARNTYGRLICMG